MRNNSAQEVQSAVKESVNTYQLAKAKYSEAAKVLSGYRLLADHPNATDAEIAQYVRAKKIFKTEAKIFHTARMEFQRRMRIADSTGIYSRAKAELLGLIRQKDLTPSEHLERLEQLEQTAPSLEDSPDYTQAELSELKKKTEFKTELESGAYDEIIAQLQSSHLVD